MVSLGDDSRRQGGYFFDNPDGGMSSQDEDLLTESTLGLSGDEDPGFRQIRTVWLIVTLVILSILLEVALFVVPAVVTEEDLSSFSVLVYSHAGLWFVILGADRYLRYQHYISRTSGYLEFYRKTRKIRRLPLMIYSGGTALLTVLVTLVRDHCKGDQHNPCPGLHLTPLNYLQILVSLEMAVIVPILFLYLVRTVRFNKTHASPDVNQDDLLSSAFLQTQLNAPDIGFRDEEYLDDVLEKQADLIRYLKQHNANLGRKIIKLTAELGNNKPPK